MSLYDTLLSWETEYQSVIRPIEGNEYETAYSAHLVDLHATVQRYLKENKPEERKPGKVKLSKPWTSPHTGQTRVYVNGLGLGEGYKVFFHTTDADTVDCRLTLPKGVWQDVEDREREQARFEQIKGELLETYGPEASSLIAKEN